MENLVIRRAEAQDAEEMIEYLNLVGGESDNLMHGKDEFQVPAERVRAHIEHVLHSPNSVILVGTLDGKIVARAALEGYPNKRMSHRAKLSVSVKKEYWRRGIGTALLDALIVWARRAQVMAIELEVLAGNRAAIDLYHKMGFWDVGVYENFWHVGGRYEDAILMCLNLRE